MAALSENDRVSVWATVMERASAERASVDLTKEELRAAIDAVDDWIDANAASFNSALPLPARTVLTTKQKVFLFMYVLTRRYEVT